MLLHSICKELGIKRDCFEFMFQNLHCNTISDREIEDKEEQNTDEDSDNVLMEGLCERVSYDQNDNI